ncbi:MAG: Sir2 family NAD-dependent protein deacetylase, partial [Candidatus Eisenbacteria bacterium]
DPKLVWEWYRFRQKTIAAAAPNAAHEAIVRIERAKSAFTLITQNVDGLHRRAGSVRVVELHGNIFRALCPFDGSTRALTGEEEEPIPRCAKGHAMRPDVVWYGEVLPEEAIAEAHRASVGASLFLVVGTSALVHPAASFPLLAADSGARLVELNLEESPLTPLADLSFRGKAAEILPPIVERALAEGA